MKCVGRPRLLQAGSQFSMFTPDPNVLCNQADTWGLNMSLVLSTAWTGAGDNHLLSRLFLQCHLDLWIMQTKKLANMKMLRLSRAVQIYVLTTTFLLLIQLFITVYCSGKWERAVYTVAKGTCGKRPLTLGWTIFSSGICGTFLLSP